MSTRQIVSLGPQRQIGGNCFLVQFNNGSKYFLDCGIGLLKTEELAGESFWNVYSYPKQLLTDFDFYPLQPFQHISDKFNLTDSSVTLLISHPHPGDYSLAMRLFEMIKKYAPARPFFVVKNYYDWIVGKETREHLEKEVIPQELTKLLQELFQSGKIKYATKEKDVSQAISPVLISTTYLDEMAEFKKIIRYSFDKVFSKCLVVVNLSMSYTEHWIQKQEDLYELLKLRKILFEPYYTSGHATVSEIIDLIRVLKPKTVIPTHSFNLEYFHTLIREAGLDHRIVAIPYRGEIIETV